MTSIARVKTPNGTGPTDFTYSVQIRRITSSGGNISGRRLAGTGAFSTMRRDKHHMSVPITAIDSSTTSTQYYRLYLTVPDDDGRGALGFFKGIIIGVR